MDLKFELRNIESYVHDLHEDSNCKLTSLIGWIQKLKSLTSNLEDSNLSLSFKLAVKYIIIQLEQLQDELSINNHELKTVIDSVQSLKSDLELK